MNKELRKVLLFISIFFLLLTFFFFWKEPLKIEQRINDQKLANFFVIIGSLATATSLLLLYNQIKEMQEERKASNKPELYPEITYYNILRLESFQDRTLLEILPTRTIQEKEENYDNHINVFNIGLGTAKEIEIGWLFDKGEIENLIKGTYYYNDDQIAKNQHFNFLLANSKIQIDPPYFYLKCCGRDFNKKEIPVKELVDVTKSDKPKLNLQIKYMDIYNNIILKTFDVIIHAHFDNAIFMFREII